MQYGDLDVRLEGKDEGGAVPAGFEDLAEELPNKCKLREFYEKWKDVGYVISQTPVPMQAETTVVPQLSCGPARHTFLEIALFMVTRPCRPLSRTFPEQPLLLLSVHRAPSPTPRGTERPTPRSTRTPTTRYQAADYSSAGVHGTRARKPADGEPFAPACTAPRGHAMEWTRSATLAPRAGRSQINYL
jgi:hypothetical protein